MKNNNNILSINKKDKLISWKKPLIDYFKMNFVDLGSLVRRVLSLL